MKRLIAVLALSAATLCLAQSTEYLRPTADATATDADCSGTIAASSSLSAVYSSKSGTGPTGTANNFSQAGTSSGSKYQGRVFTAWQTTANSYSALSIKISTACSSPNSGGGGGCYASYSTNGSSGPWTNFYSIYSGGVSDPQTTHTATITGSALANLQVKVCAVGTGADISDINITTMSVYDIWTVGTYTLGSSVQPGIQVIGRERPRPRLFHSRDLPGLMGLLGADFVVGGLHRE